MKLMITLIIIHFQTCQLSFYFDRVPSFKGPNDYLIFDVLTDGHKQVIYKLPKLLSHKETLRILICKKGTI